MTPVRPMEDVYREALDLSQQKFELRPIGCPEDERPFEGLLEQCFATDLTAVEFANRVEALMGRELRERSGWRDNYGTLAANFVFRNQTEYTFALHYTRRDSHPILKRRPDLARSRAMVRVMLEQAVPLPGE